MDIALDLNPASPNYFDLLVEDGDLVLVDGPNAIKQHILQRLRTFYGEWFLDNTIGVPWFQQILGIKNPDQARINALLLNTILATPGVIQVTEYSFQPDFALRMLTVGFTAQVTDGVVSYSGTIGV